MEKVKVSVITVGMNHGGHIGNLYRSLYVDNPPSVPFEAIYVDNCSTDGSVEFLAGSYPQVRVIRNEAVKGFGENNNIGASVASGEYLAIINPDVIFLPGSLDELCRYADGHAGAGIVAPKLLDPDGSVQYSVRGFITLRALLARMVTRGNDDRGGGAVSEYLCKGIDHGVTQAANWVSGAGFLIRKDVFDMLSGFDTDYFLYMEDEDLCLRVWRSGYSVVYHPESRIVHNSQRESLRPGRRSLIHMRSILTFFRKHGLRIGNYARARGVPGA